MHEKNNVLLGYYWGNIVIILGIREKNIENYCNGLDDEKNSNHNQHFSAIENDTNNDNEDDLCSSMLYGGKSKTYAAQRQCLQRKPDVVPTDMAPSLMVHGIPQAPPRLTLHRKVFV